MSLRYLDAGKVKLQSSASRFVEKGCCQLAEDSLFLKGCFQFLDSLFFSREDMVMPNTSQGHQVFRSVVIFDSIQMMYYPAIRQSFVVCHFPIKNMFAHIASFFSPRMFRLINIDIALLVGAASLPIRAILTCAKFSSFGTVYFPVKFHLTTFTASRFWVNWLTTIKASISSSAHAPIVSYYSLTMQGVQ